MNGRMRELLSQAGVHYEVMPKDTVYEKFAELIVLECINEVEGLQVSQSTLDWSQHWNRAIAHTALHLKEHFGVDYENSPDVPDILGLEKL